MVLDHLIRRADPVLQHAVPFMKELVATTGLDCVATGVYSDQLLDIHREYSGQPATLSYGRGRPRPLFLGAAPKVVLACLPPAQLRRLFHSRPAEVAAAACPPTGRPSAAPTRASARTAATCRTASWKARWARWPRRCCRPTAAVGAISLVASVERLAVLDLEKLAQLVKRAAGEIGRASARTTATAICLVNPRWRQRPLL